MSDCDNLIDLSLSFEEASKNPSMPPDPFQMSACLISAPENANRQSLDNNPFDRIQKLSQRPSDPFDMVEQEACDKAHQETHVSIEVKTGNLLSLSDDNILEDNCADSPARREELPQFASDATLDSAGSTIHHISDDLCSESPPLTVSARWTPDSGGPDSSGGGGGGSSDGSAGGSTKSKKAPEYRKRLLKLSISNSSFNSPVSRRMPYSFRSDGTVDTFEGGCDEPMIAAESPLKLIDDDLMSEQPPVSLDKQFDADLEMLKIPMLQEMPKFDDDVEEVTPTFQATTQLQPPEESKDNVSLLSRSQNTSTVGALPNLDALRAKLRSRREETAQTASSASQDIPGLIKNLKSLICDIDAVDEEKKMKASSLLESLSSALASNKAEPSADALQVPQPIKRQGTFDIDLKEQEQRPEGVAGAAPLMTQSYTKEVHHLEPGNIADVPDAMFKSSATYDGEPVEERDLMLPRIDSMPPETTHNAMGAPPQPAPGASDVNDIIEQLSKLLEQHQLNQQQLHHDSADASTAGQATPACGLNPTFIVVMNSSQQQVASLQSAMERSFHNESLAEMDASCGMRRRSQSLSIHDKVKFVQLPMGPPMAAADEEVATTPPNPGQQIDGSDFKTPSRPMARRNSFSSGTPYTPMMDGGGAAAAAAAAARRAFVMNSANSRRASILDAAREQRQQQAIVKPMRLTQNAMPTFKPDMKKSKPKESIMKSTGPLKATIPVKKVAPMLKHSPPTPEKPLGTAADGVSHGAHNSSIHLLSRASKMSYTSTPMPLSRSAGALGVPSGFPNACSTPTVNASPVRSVNRSRYSYGGNMSMSKQQQQHSLAPASAAGAGMKRRTLTELKAKSPLKSRPSVGSSSAATSGSALSRATAAKAAATRAASKLQQASSLPTRAPSRLSTRTSLLPPGAQKNKENRQP